MIKKIPQLIFEKIKPIAIAYRGKYVSIYIYDGVLKTAMPEVSITPTEVKIGSYLSFYATGLYPNKEYYAGVCYSKIGGVWAAKYTSNKNGEIRETYYIGENLTSHKNDIDEFVIIDPAIPSIIAWTPLKII
jgi:hypothetical protein